MLNLLDLAAKNYLALPKNQRAIMNIALIFLLVATTLYNLISIGGHLHNALCKDH